VSTWLIEVLCEKARSLKARPPVDPEYTFLHLETH